MENTMDLDDLMGELGVENTDSSKLIEYLTDCGGFDVIDFESVSTSPKKQIQSAKDYYADMKLQLDPTQIMIVREGSKVWLYLMEFYYKLNELKEPNE